MTTVISSRQTSAAASRVIAERAETAYTDPLSPEIF